MIDFYLRSSALIIVPEVLMFFSWPDLLLVAAAFFGGALNSIAGGGTFLTFPALIFYGIPPITANASSTVALFPGSFAATWAYRNKFGVVTQLKVSHAVIVSLVGGFLGAELLLKTPESSFKTLIPYLILFATLLFTFGRNITDFLQRRFRIPPWIMLIGAFLTAIYGGYFGGGIGILLLAFMALIGMKDLHAMNAVKTLLAGCLNAVAVVLFISVRAVDWRVVLPMVVGAMAGGFVGASVAQRINQVVLKHFISVVGFGLTVYFFVR